MLVIHAEGVRFMLLHVLSVVLYAEGTRLVVVIHAEGTLVVLRILRG